MMTRANKTAAAALGVALAWFGTPAHAAYRDLSQAFDAYAPGAFYRAQLTPTPTPPPEPTPVDFEAQVKALEAARTMWTKALDTGRPTEGFYTLTDRQRERLTPGATDDDRAAGFLADGFSLDDLEGLAWLRNPKIRAAERTLRGTLERYTQSWNLDEILRQYTAFTEGVMPGVGPMKGQEPVRIRFPFPGVLALKGQIVGQEAQAAAEDVEIARRTAVTAARKAYWNLGFVGRAHEITAEMLSLLQHLESVAKTRYEAGETSFQDVIKVRIRRQTLEEDLQTLLEKERTLQAKIREVLNLPRAVPVGVPAAVEPTPALVEAAPLYALADERRQELRKLRAVIGKMERMVEMAETRIQPGYSLNLSLYEDRAVTQVGSAAMQPAFATTTTADRGAGLPKLPWYGTGDAFVRETRQKIEALKARLVKAEDTTRFQVRNAWFNLDRASREETLYAKSIVGLSQAALEVSTRGYEAGKVMFADVIGSYTTWLASNLTRERKRADLGVAWAELDAAVGVSGTGR